MTTVTRKCARCGDPFTARSADVKRGWARFCSKSCKAIAQEQRTGQYRALLARNAAGDDGDCHPFSEDAFRSTM